MYEFDFLLDVNRDCVVVIKEGENILTHFYCKSTGNKNELIIKETNEKLFIDEYDDYNVYVMPIQ